MYHTIHTRLIEFLSVWLLENLCSSFFWCVLFKVQQTIGLSVRLCSFITIDVIPGKCLWVSQMDRDKCTKQTIRWIDFIVPLCTWQKALSFTWFTWCASSGFLWIWTSRAGCERGELDACVVWDHLALIQLCCYFYRIWKIIFISHCKFRFTETVTIIDVNTRKVWTVGGICELVVIQDKVRVSSTKWEGTNSLTQTIEATTNGYKDYS